MNFSSFIAKRYLFSKSSNNAVNIITIVSIFGVAFGTMALLIVLSAFSGLEKFSSNMLSTFNPDINITSYEGKSFLYTPKIDSIINSNPNICCFSRVLEEKVFLKYREKEYFAKIKGVDSLFTKVNKLDTTIYSGRWININDSNTYEVVIGGGVSHYLSLGLRDTYMPLEVYTVKPLKKATMNPTSSFTRKNAIPVGVFSIEKKLDEKYIFSSLNFSQELLDYKPNQISAIEIKVKNNTNNTNTVKILRESLGDDFIVKTRREQNYVIYKMMNTEKIITYLIFTLILIIAAFNIVGSVSMLIVDKKSNIHTLWHIGASQQQLKKIFFKVGIIITLIGGVFGILLGSLVILAQIYFQILKFGKNSNIVYPVELNMINISIAFFTIFFIGYFASKISVIKLKNDFYKK